MEFPSLWTTHGADAALYWSSLSAILLIISNALCSIGPKKNAFYNEKSCCFLQIQRTVQVIFPPSTTSIIFFIPLRKLPQAIADSNLRCKSIISLKASAVRVSDRHITGLHTDKPSVAFKIIIFRQNVGTNQFFLQGRDVVEKVFGRSSANIVDCVRRQRKAVFASLSFRSTLHDAKDAFNDVVDVGKVALHIAVVEDFDRSAFGERVGCGEVEHVRAACGSVNREEAEAGGRDIVELAVAVRQELIGLFCSRVKGDRIVDFVFYCEGHFFVASVHGGTRGVDEVLNAGGSVIVGVTARLEDVVESYEVALDVDVRVVDGVADAGLCCKIYNDRRLIYCEDVVY